MKCNEAEKQILLKASGELKHPMEKRLAEHILECASCKGFERMLIETGEGFLAEAEPSAKVVQDIVRIARLQAPEPRRLSLRILKPALAMAASFVVIMGMVAGNLGSSNEAVTVLTVTDTQMLNPEDQVLSIMYDGLSEDDLAFNFLMTFDGNIEG